MDVELKRKTELNIRADEEHEQKLSTFNMDRSHLTTCSIPHRGAVSIHIAQLWDGVFGIDRDDDLRPGLVPVKPTWNHFLTLQDRFQTNNI